MIRVLIALTATSVMTACATTPIPATSAKPISEDRLLAFQQKPAPSFATLVVTRDVGLTGSACFSGFMINGQLVARFAAGETAQFYVEPGEIVLRSGVDPQGRGLCGFGKDRWTQRETILRAGEIKYFRLSLSPDGIPDVQRAPE